MGWWAPLGMVAMAGQAGSDADRVRADPYCRDIFGIVAASGQGFAPIKGAWRTDDDEWVSLITLPGADECSIRPWTEQDLEFACKWAVADTATANATARTMADKLRWCAWHGLDAVRSAGRHAVPDRARRDLSVGIVAVANHDEGQR